MTRITYSNVTETSNRRVVVSKPLTSTDGFEFSLVQQSKLRTNHVAPSDKKMSKVLEPNEFETPTPRSPLRIINIHDKASGVQFPAAKKVKPITASEIPNVYPDQIFKKTEFFSKNLVLI